MVLNFYRNHKVYEGRQSDIMAVKGLNRGLNDFAGAVQPVPAVT